jgi:hypothetical protein
MLIFGKVEFFIGSISEAFGAVRGAISSNASVGTSRLMKFHIVGNRTARAPALFSGVAHRSANVLPFIGVGGAGRLWKIRGADLLAEEYLKSGSFPP